MCISLTFKDAKTTAEITNKVQIYRMIRCIKLTIFVKCKPFIDAICVSFGLLRLSSKASILGIDVVLLRKLFSNQKICDIG